MTDRQLELLRQHLDEAITAEREVEKQLRAFAADGDDDDVKATFAAHADETRTQHERLATRLEKLGGDAANPKPLIASLLNAGPTALQLGHVQEERTVQNLIIACTVEAGECAMYEVLAAVAQAAGDTATSAAVREMQSEHNRAAQKMWHFLPTRSKIAYNMLTIAEIDPSVETKVGERSWA